jgi:arylformamidase
MAAVLSRNPYADCPVHDATLLAELYDNNWQSRNLADLKALQTVSAQAYEQHAATQETVRFGDEAWQSFDVFRPAEGLATSVLVFVHGGRWMLNSSQQTAFWAEACCEAGMVFIGLNFRKLHDAGLGAQIDSARDAITAALDFAAGLGIDVSRVCLAGHSSGAHLAVAALLPRPGRAAPAYAGKLGRLLVLGGIYDLAPLRSTVHQDVLKLTHDDAEQGGVLQILAQAEAEDLRLELPNTLVAAGDQESPEFIRQSRALHWGLQAHAAASWLAVPDTAHFDAALEFNAPVSALRHFAQHGRS